MYKRIILLVMDSVGIGHAADAAKFGDEGANTLGHIESTAGQIHCPNLNLLAWVVLLIFLILVKASKVLLAAWLSSVLVRYD